MDKSETIREFIRAQFKSNFDFTNKDARQKLFQDYCTSEEGKAAELDWNKHNTLFLSNFKKVCRELKKDPTMYGLSRDKVEFKTSSDDGSVSIKPKPKGFKGGSGLPPSQPKQDGTIKTEDLENSEGVMVWDVKLSGIACTTFYNLISKKWTNLLPLTEEEKETLGTAWQPILQKYLSKNWGLWGMPLMVSFGILSNKFSEAKATAPKDESKPAEKKPAEEKKPDTNVETDEDAKKRFEQWKATHKA